MTYRVTFMERTNAAAQPSENPPGYVSIDLPDGVVLDRTLVERSEPATVHSEERLEEDDDFLAAVKNSQMAMECVPLDDDAGSDE